MKGEKMKKIALGISIMAILGMLVACSSAASVTASAPIESTQVTNKTASTSGAEVSMANFKFSPAELTVKVGTKVTWTNTDSAGHTVTASDGSWDSGNLSQGQSFSMVFNKVGTVDYKCTFHPGMVGKIIVTN
jgi:plastocyanin